MRALDYTMDQVLLHEYHRSWRRARPPVAAHGTRRANVAALGLNPATEHWWYNTETGALQRGTNIAEIGIDILGTVGISTAGWHELNISGNATEAQAAAEAKKEFPAGKAPTTSITGALSNEGGVGGVIGATAQALGSASSDASAVNTFFGDLTSRTKWIQILKIVIGGAMLLEGLMRASGAQQTIVSTLKRAAA
jgi:hypothetical protein